MLLMDLAVPRDIEAQVGEIADAYLYSIDDISGAIEDNVKSRSEAASQAENRKPQRRCYKTLQYIHHACYDGKVGNR